MSSQPKLVHLPDTQTRLRELLNRRNHHDTYSFRTTGTDKKLPRYGRCSYIHDGKEIHSDNFAPIRDDARARPSASSSSSSKKNESLGLAEDSTPTPRVSIDMNDALEDPIVVDVTASTGLEAEGTRTTGNYHKPRSGGCRAKEHAKTNANSMNAQNSGASSCGAAAFAQKIGRWRGNAGNWRNQEPPLEVFTGAENTVTGALGQTSRPGSTRISPAARISPSSLSVASTTTRGGPSRGHTSMKTSSKYSPPPRRSNLVPPSAPNMRPRSSSPLSASLTTTGFGLNLQEKRHSYWWQGIKHQIYRQQLRAHRMDLVHAERTNNAMKTGSQTARNDPKIEIDDDTGGDDYTAPSVEQRRRSTPPPATISIGRVEESKDSVLGEPSGGTRPSSVERKLLRDLEELDKALSTLSL
ncbi:unnamed protein product [Amoebophrya sp. A25]|nr:unnamed protein product [Amoebophrya sp. A25]|eukprot:GSA25T00015707001.1